MNLSLFKFDDQDAKRYLQTFPKTIVDTGTYNWNEVVLDSIEQNPGKFLLIPSTFDPIEGDFTVEFYFNEAIEISSKYKTTKENIDVCIYKRIDESIINQVNKKYTDIIEVEKYAEVQDRSDVSEPQHGLGKDDVLNELQKDIGISTLGGDSDENEGIAKFSSDIERSITNKSKDSEIKIGSDTELDKQASIHRKYVKSVDGKFDEADITVNFRNGEVDNRTDNLKRKGKEKVDYETTPSNERKEDGNKQNEKKCCTIL